MEIDGLSVKEKCGNFPYNTACKGDRWKTSSHATSCRFSTNRGWPCVARWTLSADFTQHSSHNRYALQVISLYILVRLRGARAAGLMLSTALRRRGAEASLRVAPVATVRVNPTGLVRHWRKLETEARVMVGAAARGGVESLKVAPVA